MPVEGRGPGSGTLTERANGEGDWHQPNNSREDPGAQEEALPQGQAGKGALTCACLVVNPVREPGAPTTTAGPASSSPCPCSLHRGRETSKIGLDILSPTPPTVRLNPYGRDEGEEAYGCLLYTSPSPR